MAPEKLPQRQIRCVIHRPRKGEERQEATVPLQRRWKLGRTCHSFNGRPCRLVVRSETQVFAAMVLVTLHFLSGCSTACEEPVGFVKECLVVDEGLYVDPEATPDIDDPNLFAQQHEQTTGQH